MKKLLILLGILLSPLLTHGTTLPLVENEAVYLIHETSCSITFFGIENKQGPDHTQKIWFSVTPRKEEGEGYSLEFIVYDFIDSDRFENGFTMDTTRKYCSNSLQEAFFLLQKHLVGQPILVKVHSDGDCEVDPSIFEKIENENVWMPESDKDEPVKYSIPQFASAEFYKELAEELLKLKEKDLQIGTIVDCLIGSDIASELAEVLGKNATILQDAGMFMITDMEASAMRGIYRADCRIKDGFFIYQGSAKGSLQWDLGNLLRRSSHIDYEIQGALLSLSYMVIKASEDLSPWHFHN